MGHCIDGTARNWDRNGTSRPMITEDQLNDSSTGFMTPAGTTQMAWKSRPGLTIRSETTTALSS